VKALNPGSGILHVKARMYSMEFYLEEKTFNVSPSKNLKSPDQRKITHDS